MSRGRWIDVICFPIFVALGYLAYTSNTRGLYAGLFITYWGALLWLVGFQLDDDSYFLGIVRVLFHFKTSGILSVQNFIKFASVACMLYGPYLVLHSQHLL